MNKTSKLKRTSVKVDKQTLVCSSVEKDAKLALHLYQSHHSQTGEFDIIFLHGALAYAEREDSFFEYLLKNLNIHQIFASDLVGHGKSSGARAFVTDFNTYVGDFFTILDQQKEISSKPYFIIAHSLGGLITLYSYLEFEKKWYNKPQGIILLNPCIKSRDVVDFPLAHELLTRLAQATPHLRLPRMLKGSDLTSDPIEANRFDTDSLVPHYITASMAYAIQQASAEIRSMPYFIDTNCYFLLSDEDKIIDTEMTKLFVRAMDKKFVSVDLFPDCKHELLHEKDKDKVFEKIKNWIALHQGSGK